MSIYKNVAFPMKLAGFRDKDLIRRRVEQALQRSYLWEEVKDRLAASALSLSGGQQQRLCIARALVMEPQVLLLDEPTSSLDTRAGGIIEELLLELRKRCTLLVVSHYLDQVKRIADNVVQLSEGRLISYEQPEDGSGTIEKCQITPDWAKTLGQGKLEFPPG